MKHCRSCNNIFHITGGENIKDTFKLCKNNLPKGEFKEISIKDFSDNQVYIRINRLQFTMLSKVQYHEKAEEMIKNFEDRQKGKIPLDEKLKYNLWKNNFGHIENRFENPIDDFGPDNKSLIKKHIKLGAGAGIASLFGGYKLYKSYNESESQPTESTQNYNFQVPNSLINHQNHAFLNDSQNLSALSFMQSTSGSNTDPFINYLNNLHSSSSSSTGNNFNSFNNHHSISSNHFDIHFDD